MTRAIVLDNDEQERLTHFLKRRQLNESMVALLKQVKEDQDLKRGQVTTAQNATYDSIIESLTTSLNEGWVTTQQVVDILDGAEIAGRQHVCVFSFPDDLIDEVSASIQSPATLNVQGVTLDEFWEIPQEPYTRLIKNDQASLVMKVIAPRYYWISDETQPSEDLIEIVKRREKERTAVIIKLDRVNKLLQIRVPIREKASNLDTTNSVYSFIVEIIKSQYDNEGVAWFNKLSRFPLSDSFQKIIENRTDFALYTDTPENQHFKSSMSHKAAGDDAADIRDFDQWGFTEGFARTSLRGAWTHDDMAIHVRMYADKVKTGNQMSREVCRLFFPRPCTDEQVEHVIDRIKAHLP